MTTLSHPPASAANESWTARLLVTEMWAALAIVAMWIAVAVACVWGPDFVSTGGPGSSSTTIPSGIAIEVFASIGTWAVAKHAFGHRPE